jgi:hypothetical protein
MELANTMAHSRDYGASRGFWFSLGTFLAFGAGRKGKYVQKFIQRQIPGRTQWCRVANDTKGPRTLSCDVLLAITMRWIA